MIPPHLLESIPLLGDGSPGDWLAAQRRTPGGFAEAVNLRRPEWVQAAHDDFFQAGARVLRTNSAQANAVRLAALEMEERCEAINNSAMAVLRAAIGQQALVMGAIGEIAPDAPLPDRERAYAQQAVYLQDTGTDFVLLDGFRSLEEATLVLRLVRNAGDAPVLCVLQADARGVTPEGPSLVDAVKRLADESCDAVGVLFPADAAALVPVMEPVLALDLPTAVFLGAEAGGLSPEAYAALLAPLADLRVVILGGGRHIGPPHVAALAARLARTPESAP